MLYFRHLEGENGTFDLIHDEGYSHSVDCPIVLVLSCLVHCSGGVPILGPQQQAGRAVEEETARTAGARCFEYERVMHFYLAAAALSQRQFRLAFECQVRILRSQLQRLIEIGTARERTRLKSGLLFHAVFILFPADVAIVSVPKSLLPRHPKDYAPEVRRLGV